MDTYIVSKFQLSTSSRFRVICKKVKTWTHLPEKPLSKTKELAARAQCPNYHEILSTCYLEIARQQSWKLHSLLVAFYLVASYLMVASRLRLLLDLTGIRTPDLPNMHVNR